MPELSKARQTSILADTIVSVKDFGAVGDGVTDDTAAITAALASGAATVIAIGTCKVSSPITVSNGITFNFNKLIPSASAVNVLRVYGGASVTGTVDTSAYASYSGVAITVDGNGENAGSPFRLHIKTFLNVVVNGGGSTGTAIYFKAVDTSARITGVQLYARVNKYYYGIYFAQTSTDLSKFITSNYINIESSDTLYAIFMASSHVNDYGLDGNNFVAKGQPKSGTTNPLYVLCGQDNTFDLLPWDWFAESGTAPYAATIAQFSRRNIFLWRTTWTYLQNNSLDNSQIFIAPHSGSIFSPFISSTSIKINNNQYYQSTTSSGVATNILGLNSSNDLLMLGSSVVGANVIVDTSNSTGIYAFRRNGTNHVYFNSVGVAPGADNTYTLGSSGARWSVVYAATGAINTSDERSKTDIELLNNAEKRVAVALKSLIKKFRFKDAIAKKGDGARIHIGVIAQEVVQAFSSEGLDPMRYGLVCYDEWGEQEEILDTEGKIIIPFQEAGNRYGIRYEELLAFIISSI